MTASIWAVHVHAGTVPQKLRSELRLTSDNVGWPCPAGRGVLGEGSLFLFHVKQHSPVSAPCPMEPMMSPGQSEHDVGIAMHRRVEPVSNPEGDVEGPVWVHA